MAEKKLGIELKPGTGWATAWAAAPAALAGFQAALAQRQLGEVRTDIDNYRRQDIENPFANLSNPYENLAVATKAAEIKMEQTDQALANTLDTLRETGAAAGGATAIANAALKSKQGVAASIEKQEADNQKLQAQGQLQVDIAKGKGEAVRMEMQENRDINELNRLQAQADMAQYRRDMSIQTGLSALGDASEVYASGVVPEQRNSKLMDSQIKTANEVTSGVDVDKLISGPTIEEQMAQDTFEDNEQPIIENIDFQPNQSQLNYTGSFSDISDDVKIRDGKMQAPPGWNEQEAQNRINSWYSMKKRK
jgi:hypothetical protein